MKLNRNLTALVIVAAGFGVWVLLGDSPITTAKEKCEQHVETMTGYDLSVAEVSAMRVTGDVRDGTVQGAFTRGSALKHVACVFEGGNTKRVELDGKVLADR